MAVKQQDKLPRALQPRAVFSPHPISAGADRRVFCSPFLPGESVADYLVRNDIYPTRVDDFVLLLNDRRLPAERWAQVCPAPGDLITLRARVHGGDGGDGNKTLRTIATIAVLVASQGTLGAWAGLMTGTSVGFGGALVSIGGMLLVNALIPIKAPAIPDDKPASPSYSLQGSGNRARKFQPLPLVFGVHRMYPDHGAKPFTYFAGHEQYLVQVFNFGLSDIVISDIKIGDTALSNFDDVDWEESIGSTGALNGFPGNVDSVAGGDLVANAGSYITKTTSPNTSKIGVDISGLNYFFGREEGLTNARIFLTIEFRPAGGGSWSPFRTSGATFQVVNGDKELMRLGYTRNVTPSQYEVRVMLADSADVQYDNIVCDTDAEGNTTTCNRVISYSPRGLNQGGMTQVITLDQVKSYQPDDGDYSNQKRAALAIKASGQLNGVIDALNAIVSARVLVWNGSSWNLAVSSNPAWQFLALARGKFAGSVRLWGAGLPDARIDIESIKEWGAWCDTKGLTCNIIFEAQENVDSMLNTIAQCGRATATWTTGKLGVVYDEGGRPVTGAFGMSNIIRNTFRIDYVTGKLADEITVAFINPALGYQRDTVSAAVPGVSNPVNTVTIELKGCTDKAMAGKAANLLAAQQFYRRRHISWESDIEGLAVQRGEVVLLSHDLTQWSYSGRLVAGTTSVLTLDEAVPFTPAADHYVGIRFPDGSFDIYDVGLASGEQDVITLTTPLPSAPDADPDNAPQDYLWFFAPQATPGKKVKLIEIAPISQHRVRVVATDEEDDYYLSELNSYSYVPPWFSSADLPTISGLTIGESLIIVGTGYGSRVSVNWGVEGEYGGATIRARDEDTDWRDIGRTLDRRYAFEWPAGKTVEVEVWVHNLAGYRGDSGKDTVSLFLIGKQDLPTDPTGFTALQNGDAVIVRWDPPVDVDWNGTELRYGPRGNSSWEDATPVTVATKGSSITTKDIVDGDLTFYIKHIDTSGNLSKNAAESNLVFDSDNDVIDQQEQAPAWPGTLTNFVKHHTGVLVPSSQGDTNDLGWRVFDEFVPDPYTVCTYEAPEMDIGFDDTVRISGEIQSVLRVAGGTASPKLSIDYKKNAEAYDGFEDWSIGNALCQQVKHKLTLDTDVGVAIITGFAPTVDLHERTTTETFTVAPGGSTVTFASPFHRAPFASAQILTVNSGTAAFATVENVTETGAEVHCYNLSGTDAGGTATLTLTGV